MHKKDWQLIIIILAAGFIIMLPRILSAHFGLLDDGVLLLNSVQTFRDAGFILHGFKNAGRFIPTILSFRAIAFYFSGFDPQRWYIWQSLILILTCIALAFIVRRYVNSRASMLLSVIIFLASPALIENFYTISKSEPYLVLLTSVAIVLVARYTSMRNRLGKFFLLTTGSILLLFSFGTKETALVLPFVFLSWLLISWTFSKRSNKFKEFLQSDTILFIGSLVGSITYLTLRHLLGLSDLNAYSYSGEYQLFNYAKIFFNLRNLFGWLIRDYFYLLPVFLAPLFLKPLQQLNIVFPILRWAIWMLAWLGTLLPWGYIAYYFLPFLLGAAILSGIILGHMLLILYPKDDLISSTSNHENQIPITPKNKSGVRIFCFCILLFVIPPAINSTAYATEQLTLDKANWQFVEQVSKLPPNSRLLINIPSDMEYFYEIQLFTSRILNRKDILIESYQGPILPHSQQGIYIASPIFINQVLPRVRAIDGQSVMAARQSLIPNLYNSEKIYSTRAMNPILDIGLHRLLFFWDIGDMMGYSERSIFTNTVLIYGWDMWKYHS